MPQNPCNMRPRQRKTFAHRGAVPVFGIDAFEKFAPRRNVEIEIGDFDCGSKIMRDWRCFAQCAVVGDDLPAMLHPVGAAHQGEARHRCNRRQAFAAKSKRSDVLQIFKASDFAGGVAVECEREIFWRNALPIIADPNQARAALAEVNLNGLCARI